MKIDMAAFLTSLFILLVVHGTAQANSRVTIEYFYIDFSLICPDCPVDAETERVRQIVWEIKDQYGDQVIVEEIDIGTSYGADQWEQYNFTHTTPPAVIVNHEYPMSKEGITRERLKEVIDGYLYGSEIPPPEKTSRVSMPLIIISGLIDGVNPCAFAMLIFFLAFLFSIHKTRRGIFIMGATYILGLFITYFAVGLGLLRGLTFFGVEHLFSAIGVILIVLLGFINIKDSLWPGKFSLKFPRRVVRARAAQRRKFKSVVETSSMPAALILGGLVGLCEFPCTGGIYVVILGFLAIETTFLEGLGYLILYNIMFTLPLMLVLLFASKHKRLVKIDEWRQTRKRQIKLIMGVSMVLLGLLVLYWIVI